MVGDVDNNTEILLMGSKTKITRFILTTKLEAKEFLDSVILFEIEGN